MHQWIHVILQRHPIVQPITPAVVSMSLASVMIHIEKGRDSALPLSYVFQKSFHTEHNTHALDSQHDYTVE